jgi:hypothetical protein
MQLKEIELKGRSAELGLADAPGDGLGLDATVAGAVGDGDGDTLWAVPVQPTVTKITRAHRFIDSATTPATGSYVNSSS